MVRILALPLANWLTQIGTILSLGTLATANLQLRKETPAGSEPDKTGVRKATGTLSYAGRAARNNERTNLQVS